MVGVLTALHVKGATIDDIVFAGFGLLGIGGVLANRQPPSA